MAPVSQGRLVYLYWKDFVLNPRLLELKNWAFTPKALWQQYFPYKHQSEKKQLVEQSLQLAELSLKTNHEVSDISQMLREDLICLMNKENLEEG